MGKTDEDLSRAEIIAEKFINIFDIYVLHNRERKYSEYEKFPHKQESIRQSLVLDNIFAIRTKYDYALRQFMITELYQELQDNVDYNRFETVITQLIPEFETPKETFLDIFGENKPDLAKEPIIKHEEFWKKYMQEYTPENYASTKTPSNEKRLKTFQRIYEKTEDPILLAAYEDFMEEYKTGIFTSRFVSIKYQRMFTLNNINPIIRDSIFAFPDPEMSYLKYEDLEFLIGESEACILILNDYIIKCFQRNLANFSDDIPRIMTTLFARHLISVFIEVLFERRTISEKVQLMNTFFKMDFSPSRLDLMVSNLEKLSDYLIPLNTSQKTLQSIKRNNSMKGSVFETLPSKFDRLLMTQTHLFQSQLIYPSLKIAEYLFEKNKNLPVSLVLRDNLASTLREYGNYSESIKHYRELRQIYDKKNNHYMSFLSAKNEAYCFWKLGDHIEANRIMAEIESGFSNYSHQELGAVYFNLATRYQVLQMYDREYYYLMLSKKNTPSENPRFQAIMKRFKIFEIFKKSNSKNEFKIHQLREFDTKTKFNQYLNLSSHFKLILQAEISRLYLKKAYEFTPRDWVFYKISLDLEFMMKNMGEYEKLLQEIPYDCLPNIIVFHYYSAIHAIVKSDYALIWKHIQTLYYIYYLSHSLVKQLEIPNTFTWHDHQIEIDLNLFASLDNKFKNGLNEQKIQIDDVLNSSFGKRIKFEKNLDAFSLVMLRDALVFFISRSTKTNVLDFIRDLIKGYQSNHNPIYPHIIKFIEFIFSQNGDFKSLVEIQSLLAEFLPSFNAFRNLGYSQLYFLQDYPHSIQNFEKALEFEGEKQLIAETLESIIYAYILIEDFISAQNSIVRLEDHIAEFPDLKLTRSIEGWRKFLQHSQDIKIRYQKINNSAVKDIFASIEFQFFIGGELRGKSLDFGFLLGQISKAFEIFLGGTLAEWIVDQISPLYSNCAETYWNQRGSKDRLFYKFLRDPQNQKPTLGNWGFLLRGYLEDLNNSNEVIQSIWGLFRYTKVINQESLQKIYNLIFHLREERNEATHSKVMKFQEIYPLIQKLIPLMNRAIEVLLNFHP